MAGNKNSGRRPRNKAIPFVAPEVPGAVEKPRMSKQAGAVWDELASRCVENGSLKPSTAIAFKTLCELEATLRLACDQKDAEAFAPFTLAEDYNGVPTLKEHRALKLERDTAAALRPFYQRFGLMDAPSGSKAASKPKGPASIRDFAKQKGALRA